jgi:hypothetical protein
MLISQVGYASTAYACVWTYRRTLRRFARNFWLHGAVPFPFLDAAAVTEAFAQSAIDMYAPDHARPTSAQLVVWPTPQCTKRQFVDAGFVADGTCLRVST